MDLRYWLYDTAVFGNVANFDSDLFRTAQGADSVHSESFTNSRGSGSLPNEESFVCDWIGVTADFNTAAPEDYQVMWLGSFLEIRIGDKTMLKAPLHIFANRNSYNGAYTLAVAADNSLIGLEGDGYHLDKPIAIPGGTSFRVRVFQALALSAANKNVKVELGGILTLPG